MSNNNELFDKIDFNEFYKTADILISTKRAASNYLQFSTKEEKFKLFEMSIDDLPFEFQSWRSFRGLYENNDMNNITNTKPIFKVDEKIKLYFDNSIIPTGYSYDLGKISDLTKSGAFSTLQNLAEGVAQFESIRESIGNITDANDISNIAKNYQNRINPLKNVPYFQNISTSVIDSLSFTFNWGQFGLYNCELEVVKPIFALANCFGFALDSEGYINTPFDPKFEVTTKAYTKLFTKGKKEVDSAFKSIKNNKSLNTESIGNLTKSLNEIYTEVAGSTAASIALFRIGGGVFGPAYVSEVNWEFDYSQQDEYGMPYKSKITLSGIKPLIIEDINSFYHTGGVKL